MHDWNPNYIIEVSETSVEIPGEIEFKSKQAVDYLLERARQTGNYKKHYYPQNSQLKVFLNGGSMLSYNIETKKVLLETIKKRPFFHSINFLHYNPGKLWKWFSDVFAACLILITISGTIILKGKNGIKQRGWILILAGIALPLIIFFLY